jgi:hypothetical protein
VVFMTLCVIMQNVSGLPFKDARTARYHLSLFCVYRGCCPRRCDLGPREWSSSFAQALLTRTRPSIWLPAQGLETVLYIPA